MVLRRKTTMKFAVKSWLVAVFPLLLVCGCAKTGTTLEVDQKAFENDYAIAPSLAARNALLTSSYDESVTSASIRVSSSVLNQDGRGFLLNETIENLRQDQSVSSTFKISAKTHSGKEASLEGNILYSASMSSALVHIGAEDASLSDVNINPDLTTYIGEGKRLASALPEGQSVLKDERFEITIGFLTNGNIATSFRHTFLTTGPSSENRTLDAYVCVYAKTGDVLRLIQYASYCRYGLKSNEGEFRVTARVDRDYDYRPVAIGEAVTEDLPPYRGDYIISEMGGAFMILPAMDISSLFRDGVATFALAPYVDSFRLPSTDTGYGASAAVFGKSGGMFGGYDIFFPRLSQLN